MKIYSIALAVLLSVASATGASALTFSKQSSSIFGSDGGRAIVSNMTNRSGSYYAGGFRLNDGTSDLIAWCLDVTSNLNLSFNYETTETPFTNSVSLGATRIANIQKLFDTAYATVDLTKSSTGNAQSAGFQMALWELVYENLTGPFNVSTGDWTVSSTMAAVDAANGFLANLAGPITQKFNLTFYQSDTNSNDVHSQNLVSATPVPLPAAGLMLLAGLGGLAVAARRKRKVAA